MKVDIIETIIQFWPTTLTFIGGCVMRNAPNKYIGLAVLTALIVIAAHTMAYSYLPTWIVCASLFFTGFLGLVADMKPISREMSDLFGINDA